jgi:hypothetical protein
MKLLKFFSTFEDYYLDFSKFNPVSLMINDNDERIYITIIQQIPHRKGCFYYVIQKSRLGVRYLVYIAKNVKHSSDSLGSEVVIPNDAQLLKTFTDFMDSNEDFKPIYPMDKAILHIE